MPEFSATVKVETSYTYTIEAPDQEAADELAEKEADKLEFQLVDADSGDVLAEPDTFNIDIEDVVEN